MKDFLKAVARNVLPHKYMATRRINQRRETLREQQEPPVYNCRGEKKRVFFLKDSISADTPYTFVRGQDPDCILWDRYNVGLPIQFYTHEYAFGELNPYAKKNMAVFFESEVIKEKDFSNAVLQTEIMERFDVIYTFSDRILNKYSNAKFIPAGGLWYGTPLNGGRMDPDRYDKKTKMVSVVASAKAASEYHRIRLKLANDAIHSGLADGYGRFCDNPVKQKADALDDYRYSIVVENDVKPYYFTEKILDCFASMTVPIYVGAEKIGDFFNTDGIIQLESGDYDHIENILKSCSMKDYQDRLAAILDNYERVKAFRCIEDYMYRNYEDDFNF